MRSFLLLLFSLMTGCEARTVVRGCPQGWVEFTWKYPKPNGKHQSIDVVTPKETIRSTQKDVWAKKFLYYDPKKKNLRVVINELQQEDFGKYKCKVYQRHDSSHNTWEVELAFETNGCQGKFNQTAYRTAKTTITCDYTRNKYKFFCKQNGSICEDILSTKSSLKSNGTFTLTETNSSFSMSISNVSSHDAGVYWCGVETHEGSYRTALRKIQLEVKATITRFTKSPTVGQNLTYYCLNQNHAPTNIFICKGEDPSICRPLVSTAQPNKNTGKFSMEDKNKRNITVTVREVTMNDTGTYWCGAESTDKTRSNKFFHKMVMTVVSLSESTTSSTSPVSSTQPTTVSAESRGDSQVVITMIVCVAVLLLLFVLMLILIYK
ncbi:polymeric immunoglobulin receptor-like, partial [Micropterus dolomieu]|uniref:polymeric immunoglobulin receptor-like n=1 Tax=Micropterus dolomieu TaxID=147949 RepID=UPI001E8E18B9